MLELCVTTLQDALIAEQLGASRIEFCSHLEVGGTTPSWHQMATLKKQLTIPVYVLIRPREGNFIYNPAEIDSMLKDIAYAKSLGIDGIVIGALHINHTIDTSLMKLFIAAAKPMKITFHKAFDAIMDKEAGLQILIDLGVDNVLTAGCKGTAIDGLDVLKRLHFLSNNQITVMPGGGIRANCLLPIIETAPFLYIHSAARINFIMQPNEIQKMVSMLLQNRMLKENK